MEPISARRAWAHSPLQTHRSRPYLPNTLSPTRDGSLLLIDATMTDGQTIHDKYFLTSTK